MLCCGRMAIINENKSPWRPFIIYRSRPKYTVKVKITKTEIEGVVIIEPQVFGDERGYFTESFSQRFFAEEVCRTVFVQDNESKSRYGVLRGLHYQLPPCSQSKLVRVVKGVVRDFAVDIRRGSPTFGKYVMVELSGDNHRQLFIPRGFAHGFITVSDEAVFQYKCDNHYSPEHEAAIAWNDPTLAIDWTLPAGDIILSEKDRRHPDLEHARLFDYSEKLY